MRITHTHTAPQTLTRESGKVEKSLELCTLQRVYSPFSPPLHPPIQYVWMPLLSQPSFQRLTVWMCVREGDREKVRVRAQMRKIFSVLIYFNVSNFAQWVIFESRSNWENVKLIERLTWGKWRMWGTFRKKEAKENENRENICFTFTVVFLVILISPQ